MSGAERFAGGHDGLPHQGAGEAHPQCPAEAAPGGDRLGDALLNALVSGLHVLAQQGAGRGERHLAAGPLEQRDTEPALQLLDRLTHPGAADAQPLGRTAEVQFLGQGQEDLDLPPFHDP